MNAKRGDIVLYKETNGAPPRSPQTVHPAIVTAISRDGMADLTVFFNQGSPEPRNYVKRGDREEDGECWWTMSRD